MTTAASGARVRLLRFAPIVLVALAAIAVFASGLGDHLSLHELRTRRTALVAVAHPHRLLSLAGYVSLYTTAVGLSLPAAMALTLAGGLLFGPWLGGCAATLGCTLGSTVIFLICRTAVGDALRGPAGSMVARIESGVQRNAFGYITALRLLPIAPLWLANLALGFIDIPLATFVAATFIGVLPLSLVYAGLGASLNGLLASGARLDARTFMEPRLLTPLIGLALLALAPIAFKRLKRG